METPDVSLRYCISCGVFYPVLNPPSDSNLVVVLCALLNYSLIISEICWLPLLLSIKRMWIKRYTMGRKHVDKLTYSIWRGWCLFCKLQSNIFQKSFFHTVNWAAKWLWEATIEQIKTKLNRKRNIETRTSPINTQPTKQNHFFGYFFRCGHLGWIILSLLSLPD